MARCSNCEVEVNNPVKAWDMMSRPSKSGDILLLTIGLYKCPNCGKNFRNVIGKERINLKEVMQKNKMLEEMIVEAAEKKAKLEEKVKALEEEKACLLAEIEALKVIPALEEKVSTLESEVAKLREEKQVLEEKAQPPPSETAPATASEPVEAPTSTEEKTE